MAGDQAQRLATTKTADPDNTDANADGDVLLVE
jgi:hypothetical protein